MCVCVCVVSNARCYSSLRKVPVYSETVPTQLTHLKSFHSVTGSQSIPFVKDPSHTVKCTCCTQLLCTRQ